MDDSYVFGTWLRRYFFSPTSDTFLAVFSSTIILHTGSLNTQELLLDILDKDYCTLQFQNTYTNNYGVKYLTENMRSEGAFLKWLEGVAPRMSP
ncbi:MAG: hypothetical protein M3247_07070 [Thermoproteota archaeon]|nr:hypothetical protein [Thermoproteota archaeon]